MNSLNKHYHFLNEYYSQNSDCINFKSPKKKTNLPYIPPKIIDQDFFFLKRSKRFEEQMDHCRKNSVLKLEKSSKIMQNNQIIFDLLSNINKKRKESGINSFSSKNSLFPTNMLNSKRILPKKKTYFLNYNSFIKPKQKKPITLKSYSLANQIQEKIPSQSDFNPLFIEVSANKTLKKPIFSKNSSEYHLAGRFLCNIKLNNSTVKANSFTLKKILHSMDLKINNCADQFIEAPKPKFHATETEFSKLIKAMDWQKDRKKGFLTKII